MSAQQEKIFGLPAQTTMRLVNVFVCTGASVVIFGAMAKILHLSWADWALKIGLTTEAIIFLIYAIYPIYSGRSEQTRMGQRGNGRGWEKKCIYIPPIPPPFTILLRKQEVSDCYFFGQALSE
jgi:hypothetical protein